MLTKAEEDLITSYIDDYIDGLRIEAKVIGGSRVITEESSSRVIVVDRDFLIDEYSEYEVLLRNPVEDYFFIPKAVVFYVTKFELTVDRTNGFEVLELADAEVVDVERVSIDDPRVTDSGLRRLVNHMCFDTRYQKMFPEVTVLIQEFLLSKDTADIEKLKIRIAPFLAITGVEC
jgi:hypothetical protein